MKQNQAVYDTIRKDVSVATLPRLIAEFNHNRYSNPKADNSPAVEEEEAEPDLFPIESIVDGLRPRSGAVKATTEIADAAPPYTPQPPAVRHHIAEQEDVYKYWIGPEPSGLGPYLAAINMIHDPSTADGTISPWENYGVGALATSVVQDGAPAIRIEKTTGAGEGASFGTSTNDLFAAVEGTKVTLSAEIMLPVGSPVSTMSFIVRDETNNDSSAWQNITSGGALLTASNTVAADGVWRRYHWTFEVKDGRSLERVYIASTGAGGIASGPATFFYARKVMLNYGDLIDFFDGDTPDTATETYYWDPDAAPYAGVSAKDIINPANTVTTNQVTNPSFETVSSTLTDRSDLRNLATDPRGYDQGTVSGSEVGWDNTRGWGTGGAGTYSFKVGVTDGPVGINRYLRKTWTTASTATASSGFAHTIYSTSGTSASTGLAVTAGSSYTFSDYLRTNATGKVARIKVVWRTSAGAVVGTETVGPDVALVQNQWTRVSATLVAPATATRAQIVTDPDGTGSTPWAIGNTLDGTGLLIQAQAYLWDYFDGDGAGTGGIFDSVDWQVGWSGTPHNSYSFAKHFALTGAINSGAWAISSSLWQSRGNRSLRIIPVTTSTASWVSIGDTGGMRHGMQAGKTYTVIAKIRLAAPQTGTLSSLARQLQLFYRDSGGTYVYNYSNQAPNTAGVHELRGTLTIPAGATEAIVRFYNGATKGNGDMWVDEFAVIEGNYTGPYFDGESADEGSNTYLWTGTPHASTSTKSTGSYMLPPWFGGTLPTKTNPQVTYPQLVNANKIVVGIENSVSVPTEYEIYVQNTVGGAWTQIGDESTVTIPENGRVEFWWNGTAWTQTRNITTYRQIAGIQMRVSKMSKNNRYFELIEMGARLEWDLTPYMTTSDSTFDLGDTNIMAPIGRISSNVGSVQFFNALVDENDYTKGLLFNENNSDSMFKGLTKENVQFTLDYLYDASGHGGSTQEVIRQFVMYAEEDWGSDLSEGFQVSLRDASKFLQETAAPETFYESGGNMSVGEIIWMLLDSVGFVDYHIDENDVTTPIGTNFFWCDNDKKVWEVLNSLAEGTQTAIYFDEYGILQIKIKDIAFDPAQEPAWHLRGETSGTELVDIVELSPARKQIPNTVKIEYKKADYDYTAKNNIISELVWEPEESSVILRSSDLQEPFMKGDEYFMILPHQAQDWHYAGMVNIEGEIIEYEGKEYKHLVSPSTSYTTTLVKTHEEYLDLLHKTDHEAQYRNTFTGRLKVKERALWNTLEKDHVIQNYPYNVYRYDGGVRKNSTGFIRQGTESHVTDSERTVYEKQKSSVRLISHSNQPKDRLINVQTPGALYNDAPNYYGTRFIIRDAGQKHHFGGLAFCINPTNGSGYYVEVRPETGQTPTANSKRAVTVGIQHANGTLEVKNGKGYEVPIVKNKWHTLDVRFSSSSTGDDRIYVWLDGKMLGRTNISGSDKRTQSDVFGMFIRGSSCYEFEYLYAYDQYDTMSEAEANWGEDVSFYDRVINGYTANQSLNEFTSGTRLAKRRVKKKTIKYQQRYDIRFFDEFVPVVHEIRKFELKFADKMPGKYVRLLATNEAKAKYIDFRGSPFGAEFYAVNVSHDDVTIHGEEEKLGVVAQTIKQGEEKSKEFKDEESVRVSGRKELTFNSDWIQTEGQVNKIGEWITSHWGFNVDELEVTIFGNPLLQLTDIVELTEPQSERAGDRYYVIEVKNNFNAGLETTLRLRKVKS